MSRMEDPTYEAYLEGCLYMNIRVALAVGFSHVIFFLLDPTKTLDYGKKYTKTRDEKGKSNAMVPMAHTAEFSSVLRRGEKTGHPQLDKEYAFRVTMNRLVVLLSFCLAFLSSRFLLSSCFHVDTLAPVLDRL